MSVRSMSRGTTPGRRSAAEIIAGSGLPPALRRLVERAVGACRLWRGERAEVARELCAHFEDGLAAGVGEAELAEAFGDPGRAAVLITRARRRLRPWWWRVPARAVRVSAAAVLLVVALYLVLAARYFAGGPTVSRNILAEFNQRPRAVPQSDRAWPVYLRALAEFGPLPGAPGDGGVPAREPGEAGWPAMASWLRDHAGALAMARAAAAVPALGAEYGVALGEDYRAMLRAAGRGGGDGPAEPTPDNPLVVGVLLPHVTELRRVVEWLIADMRLAAADGDAGRFLADHAAVLGVGEHLVHEPFLVARLAGLGAAEAAGRVVRASATAPQFLADADLRALAHRTAGFAGGRVRMGGGFERAVTEDLLQRFYSDDGRGSGHLVMSPALDGIYADFGLPRPRMLPLLHAIRPVRSVLGPSRAELLRQLDRFEERLAADEDTPPWRHADRSCDPLYAQIISAGVADLVPPLRSLLEPPLRSPFASALAARDLAETRAAVTGAVLAAELYRRKHGAWPATLGALVPESMPSAPTDPFTGGPLLYRVTASGPVFYSVGPDLVDDGGTPPTTEAGRRRVPDLALLAAFATPAQDRSPELRASLNEVRGDWVITPSPW